MYQRSLVKSSKRVGETDDLDLMWEGAGPDDVLLDNVTNIVNSFWTKFNPGKLNINSSIAGINTEIFNINEKSSLPQKRTIPFDIDLSPGQYILNFEKNGYVSRKENITINKSDNLSFTVDLDRKTAIEAFLKSLIYPGAGQIYSSDRQYTSRKRMGYLIRLGILSSSALSIFAWNTYDTSKNDYMDAKESIYEGIHLEEIERTRSEVSKRIRSC